MKNILKPDDPTWQLFNVASVLVTFTAKQRRARAHFIWFTFTFRTVLHHNPVCGNGLWTGVYIYLVNQGQEKKKDEQSTPNTQIMTVKNCKTHFSNSIPSPGRACAASWHTPAHRLVCPSHQTAWQGNNDEVQDWNSGTAASLNQGTDVVPSTGQRRIKTIWSLAAN